MLPSASVALASPLRVYGTLCQPTSRHHCLSSSDISKLSFLQTLTCDIDINCLTSVKCSRSFFLTARHLKNILLIIIIIILYCTGLTGCIEKSTPTKYKQNFSKLPSSNAGHLLKNGTQLKTAFSHK